jgi:L-ribulose-5-phosphate 3-epimerase
MNKLDRRSFLQLAGVGVAAGLASHGAVATADQPSKKGWRKAFMLGGVSKGSVEPHFQLLREAGFEGVELISPNELDAEEVVRARDKTGLVIHGVSGSRHWQDTLSHPDKAVVERGLAAVRKSIQDCKAYGGTTVLLVPAVVTKDVSYRDAYKRSQEAVKTLIPDAEKAGIVIAIEEVWNKFLLSSVEFARYIDEFQSPWIKAYFDVGNVVEFGYPQEWIHELGSRIVKVHIKEYAPKQRFDYQLGEGKVIDWQAVRKAFEDVGYHGWITAEVPFGDLARMKDVVQRMNKIFGE